jgi:hypothetical protein
MSLIIAAEDKFGTKKKLRVYLERSILDRAGRSESPFSYNTNYSVNRSNRIWGQTMDFHGTQGPLEVANLTTTSIGREGRVGRVNRSGQTQTELAYRVSPVLRLGGRFGIQRITDVSRSASVPGTDQSNGDLSAQARFNKVRGVSRAIGRPYGYLRKDQLDQKSAARTSTSSRAARAATARAGRSRSTSRSALEPQVDRGRDRLRVGRPQQSTNVNLSSVAQVNACVSDASLTLSHQTVRRPLVTLDPTTRATLFITVPEVVTTSNDGSTVASTSPPYRTRVNVTANATETSTSTREQVGRRRSWTGTKSTRT